MRYLLRFFDSSRLCELIVKIFGEGGGDVKSDLSNFFCRELLFCCLKSCLLLNLAKNLKTEVDSR